jgi:dolichol-phosphate mannosyltransferase
MGKLKVLAAPVCYNEGQKIGRVIDRFVPGVTDEIIVVDDASTDESRSEIFKRGVKSIRHPHRMGVGAAIRTAITYARENRFDVLVILAGNDKDRPSEIPLLLRPIETGQADVAQGSRYLSGGKTAGMPFYRQIATRIHPWLMSLATGKKVTDTTNGFRAIRLSLFDDPRFNLNQKWLNAYELEPYILFKTIQLGYKLVEVPVTKIYPPKDLGYTKMKPVTGWWSILRPVVLLGLGLRK